MPELWTIFSFCVVTILMVVPTCGQRQDYPGGQRQDYQQGNNNMPDPDMYSYQYKIEYPEAQDYNYQYGDEVMNLCYTCHYLVRNGHQQGSEGCKDPFDEDDIAQIQCDGPCSKSYQKMGEKEYHVMRQCTPNCKEFYEVDSYIQCCSTRLCNGGAASLFDGHSLCLTLLTIVLLLLYTQR